MNAEPSDLTIGQLERLLETSASRTEISEAVAAAQASSGELPPLLQFRAEERIAAERMVERRRLLFAIACIFVFFGAIVGSFALVTLNQIRSSNQSEQVLDQLIESEQWEEAQKLLDSVDPNLRRSPAFAEGEAKVKQAIIDEENRQQRFQQIADQLRSATDGKIDMDLVDELDQLAESEDERAVVTEMMGKVDQQRLMRDAVRIEDQTSQFESLQQEVADFLAVESHSLTASQRRDRRRQLRKSLEHLVTKFQFSNPALADAAKQAVAMLADDSGRDETQIKEKAFVDAVTRSVGDFAEFNHQIDLLLEAVPDSRVARKLAQNNDRESTHLAAQNWIRLREHPALLRPTETDPFIAANWLNLMDQAAASEPDHPFATGLEPWQKHYRALADRPDAIEKLRSLFDSPLMQPMYVYPNDKGGPLYADVPPDRDSPRAHVVDYFADTTLTKETKNFGARYQEDIVPQVRLAGHCRFAKQVKGKVATIGWADFTPVMYGIMGELRKPNFQSDFDPIYRLAWMRQLVDVATQGSFPIGMAFAKTSRQLQKTQSIEKADWISPRTPNEPVDQARRLASQALASLPDWDKSVRQMSQQYRRFRSSPPPAPRWVGWVSFDQNRYVAMFPRATESRKLFVLTYDSQAMKSVLVPISVNQDGTGWEITNQAAQVCGAMVYEWSESLAASG